MENSKWLQISVQYKARNRFRRKVDGQKVQEPVKIRGRAHLYARPDKLRNEVLGIGDARNAVA